MIYPSLLPPSSTELEKSLEQVAFALSDLPSPIRDIWSPQTCPLNMLPWLAWGLSIDIWDANWSESVKRSAVADAIYFHRRKGTKASLRTVLERFDPLIKIVEWYEDRANLDPHTFRLELPLAADSDVEYSAEMVAQILRDIGAVKPVRAHMFAVHRLQAQTEAWLVSAASLVGYNRMDGDADVSTATDPSWHNNLQTEDGEPIEAESGSILEVV